MTTAILPKEIIKEWGLESLPETQQVDIVDRLGKMIYQAVLVRTLDILSEKEQVEFDNLLDQDSTTPQEVISFLRSKIPTYDKLEAEERQKLKEELLMPTA